MRFARSTSLPLLLAMVCGIALSGAALGKGGGGGGGRSSYSPPPPPPQRQAPPRTYQTYTKTRPTDGKVYTGRTSGTGTPVQNVANRDSGHHMTEKGYGPARIDKSSSDKDAVRGREQHLIDHHGGAQSQGGTSGNQNRGVAPTNPKRDQYNQAASKQFGRPKK